MSTLSSISNNTMSDVEVDDILRVSSLDTDGKWLDGVKGEGNETSGCWGWIATQQTCVYLELEQSRVPCVEPTPYKKIFVGKCYMSIEQQVYDILGSVGLCT